jgi:putative ABC transport system ATP-binding protein
MKTVVLRDVVQTRGKGHRKVTVLQGASLEVDPGERVLLEGPSGSGKTTLLAVAAGMLTPREGEVLLAGRFLPSLPQSERSRLRAANVGFVFQRANLLSGLTVLENVTLAGRLVGMPGREADDRARLLLERLEMGHLAARFPRELSGGEEQRVAVARALVHRPPIVLADEPTGNLDDQAGQSVTCALEELSASSGTAVIVATHDSRLATFATRHVCLQDGRVVAD